MATCKLCNQETTLIGRSHIIPDFMYKHSGLYDEKHRLRYFSIEDLLNDKSPSLPQSGVHEGGLLCADCDNRRLGQNLENYTKKALYGGGELPVEECPDCINYTDENDESFSICENLSYSKYKLTLLSILWRASISTKPFFQGISIGELHENNLREMIFNNDPRSFNDYPIIVVTTAADKDFSSGFIIEPRQVTDTDGVETCCFIIGAFIYIFKLGTCTERLEELKTLTINEENKIMILNTKPGTTIELIKNYVGL